jgi:hypothetical protein
VAVTVGLEVDVGCLVAVAVAVGATLGEAVGVETTTATEVLRGV